jgi:WD40 repeat protein
MGTNAAAAHGEPKAKIFISYSRKDMAFADRMDAALKARGFEPLIDRTEIYAFEDWWQRIQALIGQADTVVFIISPDAVASEVALKEVARAASLNKRFAPIVFRRAADESIPAELRRRNFIFFDDPDQFEQSVAKLAEALETDIGWIRRHTEYGETARRWFDAGRPNGLLLQSPALEEAEHWIASRPPRAPAPTADTQTFIAASRRWATRRRNLLTGGLTAGLVITFAFATAAVWQWRSAVGERNVAEQQRNAAEEQRNIANQQRSAAEEQRRIADEQREQVIVQEMNRRAALSQELASAGRANLGAAIALDALQGPDAERAPTPQLQAAIHRTLHLVKAPIERYIGDNVFNLAMSPDGRTLAAGTPKGVVHILDAVTLEKRFEFKTGDDRVSGLDFSPDSKRLVAAGDKIPNVWDLATGTKLFDLQRPESSRFTFRAQYSPDGKFILISTDENRALIHDAATGNLLHVLPGASYDEMSGRSKTQLNGSFGVADPIVDAVNRANFQIWGVALDAVFSPDGKLVAVTGPANPDGSVRLFDPASGELIKTLSGGRATGILPPLSYGHTLAFSPDSRSLIAAPVGLTIKIWNIDDGQLRTEFPSRGINSFMLTADGKAVVITQNNGSLVFRCLAQNSAVVSVQAHEGAVDSVSVDHDGLLFATGSSDRTARIWHMPRGVDVCDDNRPQNNEFDALSVLRPVAVFAGHGARITTARFSNDDRSLITASQDGWVRSWAMTPDSDVASVAPTAKVKLSAGWEKVVASNDGRTLFAYDAGNYRWHAWTIENGQAVDIPEGVAAIAPGDRENGPILFRSPAFQVSLGNLGTAAEWRNSLSCCWYGPVSADGSRVVADEPRPADKSTGDEEASVLLDSATQRVIARLVTEGRAAKELFFSPDGSRLFGRVPKSSNGLGDSSLAVWDARSANLIALEGPIEGYSIATPISAATNGSRVLIEPNNKPVLLDVGENGLRAHRLPDTGTDYFSGRSATAMILTPNGTRLVTGRSDGTIVIADIEANKLVRVLDTRGLPINKLAVTPDEHYIAAADTTNTVWVFDAEVGAVVRSDTLPEPIVTLLFTGMRLAVATSRSLTLVPILPAFAGRSDTASMVDSARKQGFHLVSDEDRRRYRLGASAVSTEKSSGRKWAAIDPNSEGTAPVVWADSETNARDRAVAECKQRSTTCASKPAITSDLDTTFVFYCCLRPRLGCAISSGSGDETLRSVKAILGKANYSACEVRFTLSARDGSQH